MTDIYDGKTADEKAAIEAYFKKGGKITICPSNQRTEGLETNIWKRGPGRPKKEDAEKTTKADNDE